MVRELVIDLSMAVHIEEQRHRSKCEERKVIPQLDLYEYDDEWKV